MKTQSTRSIILGAAFLMATSAIGPGFLTQTTVFTDKLLASFGFVILISIIIDIGAQTNIWRILAVSEKKAQDIANEVLPGLGYFLAALIVMGGLAFNIGNIAGAGLGTNVLFGVSPELGALLSGIVAICIFLVREAGKVMDRFAQVMGFVMIALMVYVMFTAQPPYGEAVVKSFVPDTIDLLAIVTLVGGTVGGYITFAGGHRLLDAGIKGKSALPQVTKSSVSAIGIASIMRIFLFLAALGIVSQGLALNPDNPAASVFQHAAGNVGYKIFGVIMWAAAVTSVVGAAYTSVSFIRTFSSFIDKNAKWFIVGFIAVSTIIFVSIGQPVKILVLVGSVNGLILPVALGVMLVAAHKVKIVGDYKHPVWMTIFGIIIVIAMAIMGGYTLFNGIPQLFE
ncbi:Mn2+/Fe2+ NRAMP family transporter [Cytobacillus horneckiae]|uniref:Divalent metal cation transporter n=1 Tax=Cytobacillus horneckiae TaxID=549687 RepID=A0A2N0ZKM2_9BACI|nr:NRAMP family divalent metal transporter [Cytobacillus horneckiae]MBN6888537.1 divalent metal cation transporter [Cytobacillus horneckiae]MCM3180332.1 divalent metal cation transporter [Cytobacillus horneckiae]MEC1156421.1 divalent metal cation transporter [Cytobacillus horneckiae]MED2938438.1 divalent metal cation transporter [Cytobacillus horneckiae]PKG30057.1 divalent metal cation transporter [Cytobacillus horneckiae]